MEDGGTPHDPPQDPSLRQLLLIPPPIHAEDHPEPPPESILLDRFGYLSDRTNATTAGCRRGRRSGRRILVTFWAAAPPLVSCFTVHCPGLAPSAFGDTPEVLCAEDDLALLGVAFCPQGEHHRARNTRYFVYQAGARDKPPSLRRVRTPPGLVLNSSEAVLLRCRDRDAFFLAALRAAFIDWECAKKQVFDLHLYSSRTGGWSTSRLVNVESPPDFTLFSLNTVIAIGGERGSVGWVDLWQGILICDLLLDNHHSLRYIPLPPQLVPNSLQAGYPMYVRDIIVIQGHIKYFEMDKNFMPCSDVADGWVAATKKMEASNVGGTESSWEEDCTIKFQEVPVDSPAYAEMLPDLQQGQDAELTLKRVHAGSPALSLHDGDVVYIMHRPDHRGHRASVIAVDMRTKTLKGVADFSTGRPLGYVPYIQSGISKHLGIWSTSRSGENIAETNK
ncbi:hypothetical protein PVAP13_2KG375861 [Panicum virgatum]|uniref:DUF1618 domain-containing protein n=1 Tax=Panicum virgatum TaxID=38727 RepID=A0A8T0WBX7_PANVG|nr:hypothetical protein PVAP13_2KG375861 [Panicum virgatum]